MTDLWTSRLSEYLDGTLPATDRQALEDHLADCAECPAVLDELGSVIRAASALSDSPPANDLWSGIATRIRVAPSDMVADLGVERQRRQARRISFTVPQLVAAGIVLAVLSGAAASLALRPASSASTGEATPSTAVLTASISGSELALDQALADLQQILEVGRGELDSTTVNLLERNLALIDRALAQAQQAITADPANAYLRDHLESTKRQKLSLMRRAADLVEIAS